MLRPMRPNFPSAKSPSINNGHSFHRGAAVFVFLFFIAVPLTAHAAPTLQDARGTFTDAGEIAFGGQPPSLQATIANIIRAGLGLLGIIFVSLTVYAGFLWMTAQGDDKQVTKAKDIITQAIIGLAITVGAYAITNFVLTSLATATGR